MNTTEIPDFVAAGADWTVDLGEGLELRHYPEGHRDHGWRFAHTCDRGDRGVIRCAPLLDLHTVTATPGAVTVAPSILCSDCGTHGFVTDSTWRAA